MTSGSSLSLEGLSRRFGKTQALDNFSLDVAAGEFVALLGPSGCGKTTALRAVAGFETVDSGRVVVNNIDITHTPSQRRDMGMVFQSYSLFPNMSARENVEFGLRLRGRRTPNRRGKANDLLDLVGLAEHITKFPHQLSGGQQQRVALARALAIEPQVLLLDEPLSALDAKVRSELRDHIKLLQQRLAMTTLFVTHDQEEALSLADRIAVMWQGRAEQIATPGELYAHPTSTFVAEFVGVSSRVPTVLSGRAVEIFGVDVAVRGTFDAQWRDVDALVRPEEMTFAEDQSGEAQVIRSSFLGATTRLEVMFRGALLKVDVATSDAVPVGARGTLRLSSTSVLIGPRLDEVSA